MSHQQTGGTPQEQGALLSGTPLFDFIAAVENAFPQAKITLDEPLKPSGDWWIDLVIGDFRTTLLWRAGFGFGVFTTSDGYGQRPDERYEDAGLALKRLTQLIADWARTAKVQPLWLKDVRTLLDVQQTTLADKLSVQQAAISKMEGRGDIKLSSLRAYVHALGGRVEMRVCFDHFEADIAIPDPAPQNTKLLEEA